MGILYYFVQFISTFIEGFIIAEFYRDILSESTEKKLLKYNICFSFVYTTCIRMLDRIEIFSYANLLFATIFISVYAINIYKKSVIDAISVSSFYVMCLHTNSLICLSIVSVLGNDGKLYEAVLNQKGIETIVFIILVRVVWVTLCILVKYLFRQLRVQYKFRYRSIVGILMGTTGIVFLTNQTLKSFNINLTYAWMFVITILALNIFNVYANTVDKENKAKLRMTEMRNSLLEEKYQSMKEIYTNNAKAYHDLNNHLNVLNNLLEEGNIECAKKYIADMGEPIRKLSNIIWTGNEIIDIMINFEVDKMNAKNIEYDIAVNFSKDMNISAHDVGAIIGNLLDNAIEATEKLRVSGKIQFSMKQIHQFLSIKATNPCEESFAFEGAFPKTTKEDKELHGWGLRNVSDIVEKYEGSFKCQNNKGLFEVNILLMNSRG